MSSNKISNMNVSTITDFNLFHKLFKKSRESQASSNGGPKIIILQLGPPGIGKTDWVKKCCELENLQLKTLILNNYPAVEIGGIRAPDFETGDLRHFIPDIFTNPELPEGKDGVCVHMDEAGNAGPEQWTAIQSIIQDRYHENRPVPKHLMFILSSNREEDNTGANQIQHSLLSRLFVVNREVDSDGWMDWAIEECIDPRVVSFIAWKPDALHQFDPDSEDPAQPDPRGWANVSAGIEGEDNLTWCGMIADGFVGVGMSCQFTQFIRMCDQLPYIDDIMREPTDTIVPNDISAQYAVLTGIATMFAKRKKANEDLEVSEVEASITYLRRFSEPMAMFGFRVLTRSHPDFSSSTQEFTKFKIDYLDMEL